ncbi:hypothetical protein JCM19992_26560 [Thermostilla marina]
MRALALFTAWTLALVFLVGGIYRMSKPEAIIPQEQISPWTKQLASVPVDEYSDVLGDLSDDLPPSLPVAPMVMVVQAAPDGKAIVLAVPPDSSDDPDADHWPCPWPNLNSLLAEMPVKPIHADDEHAGTRYRHQLFPIAGRAGQYLILSIPSTDASGRLAGLRWFAAAVVCVSAGIYLAIRIRHE